MLDETGATAKFIPRVWRISLWLLPLGLLILGTYMWIREREPEPPSILGRWELRSIVANGVQIEDAQTYGRGRIPWIQLNGNGYEGFDGCNAFWGTRRFNENGQISSSDTFGYTLDACSIIIGDQRVPWGKDQIFSDSFRRTYSLKLGGCELRLYYNHDTTNYLLFERQPCIPG